MTEVLWELHEGLRRQAPGSDATTLRMLEAAGGSAERALDLGAGPGAAAVLLAANGVGHVTAVDLHEPFLAEARARADAAGVGDRVATQAADMADLPFADGSFDLVWSEGAAYAMGFDDALRAWRRLLAPRGRLAVTECAWTTREPSPEGRAFWDAAYPQMRHAEDNAAAAEAAGYRLLATWVLPDSDWWDEYYDPLTERLEALPPERRAEAADTEAELAMRRAHPEEYGYVAYVLERG